MRHTRPTERELRQYIAPALRPIHGFAVETATMPGTPDVNHAFGWLELKVFKPWPKDFEAPAQLHSKFTPQQRAWILGRIFAGGGVQVLCRATTRNGVPEWLLLDGGWAAAELERVPEDVVRLRAIASWHYRIDQGQLTEELKQCGKPR